MKKKSLTQKNKELKQEIAELKKSLEKLREDRNEFRDYFSGKLKWFVSLHGEGKHPSTSYLIEDMAKLMNRVERWYW